MEAVEDVLYGTFAGMLGKYIEYPFDTVKVRLQSQPDQLPLRYAGPLDCFRQFLKSDGPLGLYQGIGVPLVGAAVETSSLFAFESAGREMMYLSGWASRDERLSLPALLLTGAFAGALTSFVLNPVELVKCRVQAPIPADGVITTGPLRVIQDVFRNTGLRGFWRGQVGTLIRETGGGAAWFGAKEAVTAMFYSLRTQPATCPSRSGEILLRPLPLWQQAVAGASAGVSYNLLFFPADTIKSRMQTRPVGGPRVSEKRTFRSECLALWQSQGLRGMYRGCGITCLRSAPSSALIFMSFDGLKRTFPL
ncbi:amino acid transporter arg-13 [Metarhizium album ARSEF 1941]|uniref:Amino acid transporter arg-13 n=1 Tax=Metarhizium album (strain ARSEF 1941) TaxID=1081103 RepID=A0A0B2X773_METAS|nr:amino acid transporter arg-13 [Metarhizium album ARSEF 1941]KHO01325.1 amino acid transporter arg-13 [Metarhizium album ARSEF 1941]